MQRSLDNLILLGQVEGMENKLEEIMLEDTPFGLLITNTVGMGGSVLIRLDVDAAAIIESLQKYLEIIEPIK